MGKGMTPEERDRWSAAARTPGERAFVDWTLDAYEGRDDVLQEILRAALVSWERGLPHLDRASPLAGLDADARLAAVELELLHAVAREGRSATVPAERLLMRPGLARMVDALPAALALVPQWWGLIDSPPSPRSGPLPPSRPAPRLAQLPDDGSARAVSLYEIRLGSDAGRVWVSEPEPSAEPGEPPVLRVAVDRVDERGHHETHWATLSPDGYRAALALFAGLRAIELLPSEPARKRMARRLLFTALAQLLNEEVQPRAAIDGAARELLSWAQQPTAAQRWVEPPVACWPSAFAVVVGALDRFFGLGGAALIGAVEVGTWVGIDAPHAPHCDAVGQVIELDAGAGTPALVRIRGGEHRIPLSWLRTPPRVPLTGHRDVSDMGLR